MGRKKIIVLTSTFPRWRDDTDPPFVYELSRRLVADFDVHIIAPHYPGARRDEIMDGLQVHRFRYFFNRFERLAGSSGILPTLQKNNLYYLLVPFFVLAELLSLLILARKIKPDVVHAHWLIPQGFVAALVKKITGVPFVVTAHGADVFGLKGGMLAFLKKFVLLRADVVTVVSHPLAEKICAVCPDICPEIIPMGVDSSVFRPDCPDLGVRRRLGIKGLFLLFVGRLSEKKGVRYLLEAMPAILARYPDARLLLVGKGELEGELRMLSRNLEIAPAVEFFGPVVNHKLPAYYAAADIFIGPSVVSADGDTEGFGLTFVEAGMSGCLLIGSNIGGIPDIINGPELGQLVAAKDPDDITRAVFKLVKRQKDWPQMKIKTRLELARRFAWPIIVSRYVEVLRAAAGES